MTNAYLTHVHEHTNHPWDLIQIKTGFMYLKSIHLICCVDHHGLLQYRG